jgi:5-methylcytosine-specific restriction endonuclease McrA
MTNDLAGLEALQTLVLNADFRPLGLCGWREAIESLVRGNFYAVALFGSVARSPSVAMQIPSVVARPRHVDTRRPAACTRRNLFLAYLQSGPVGTRWRCALCGGPAEADDLTFDHVVPRSAGGVTSFANVCLAHSLCNQRKGNRSLAQAGMRLHVPLRHPTEQDIIDARLRLGVLRPVADWLIYLPADPYWDIDLLP